MTCFFWVVRNKFHLKIFWLISELLVDNFASIAFKSILLFKKKKQVFLSNFFIYFIVAVKISLYFFHNFFIDLVSYLFIRSNVLIYVYYYNLHILNFFNFFVNFFSNLHWLQILLSIYVLCFFWKGYFISNKIWVYKWTL